MRRMQRENGEGVLLRQLEGSPRIPDAADFGPNATATPVLGDGRLEPGVAVHEYATDMLKGDGP